MAARRSTRTMCVRHPTQRTADYLWGEMQRWGRRRGRKWRPAVMNAAAAERLVLVHLEVRADGEGEARVVFASGPSSVEES
jgi:hypothetical protein